MQLAEKWHNAINCDDYNEKIYCIAWDTCNKKRNYITGYKIEKEIKKNAWQLHNIYYTIANALLH